ncbi:hypothetical protein ACFL27_02225 [candidate division CSSED10-310 bacterium]|uniref:WD40 repeat domain-containing protein n=1 Tax=candidate division CSSED10-310 bacterium TaxID=2855610 RepID=A0ABV6YS22_UNCC1
MSREKTFVMLIILFILWLPGPLAEAVQSSTWTSGNLKTLQKAEFDEIAITSDGTLTLAPQKEVLSEIDYPLFSVISLSDRKFILGTGDKSLIYSFTVAEKATVLADLNSFAVRALARGPDQRIYVGNQQAQSIDIIKEDGTLSQYYPITEKYIWDMLWDKNGNLFVATGDEGKIYRISAQNKGEVYFEADENNIMHLALTPDGKLLAGSEGSGIVYLISAKNEAHILCDTPLAEISALEVTRAGDIFFSAIPSFGPKMPMMTPTSPPQTSPNSKGNKTEKDDVSNSIDQLMKSPAAPKTYPKEGQASYLYYLPQNGSPRIIWTCPNQIILALTVDDQGNIFVGTGEEAFLYRLNKLFQPTLLYKFAAKHIVCMEHDPAGNIILGTGSPGNLIRVSGKVNNFARHGEFLSEPIDATVPSQWGILSYRADIPTGTGLKLFFRTGNSSVPDRTWGTWTAITAEKIGLGNSNPVTRFAQWKCVMESSKGLKTPSLFSVSVSFQQENLPPSIQDFFVQPDQNSGQKTARDSTAGLNKNDNTNIFSDPNKNYWNTSSYGNKSAKNQQKPGLQKLRWRTSDPNKDVLAFDLSLRTLNQRNWITIEKNISSSLYNLDTHLLPDGQYELKLIAHDTPSNPKDAAQQCEQLIPYFVIDNSAPTLVVKKVSVKDNGNAVINGFIEDKLSHIVSGEYSVNGQNWIMFAPQDNIFDQLQEQFKIQLENLAHNEYFIIIRARDKFNNVGRVLVTFTVQN